MRPIPIDGDRIEALDIIQYWHSENVPDYINGLFRTFDDLNPDMQHLIFNESSAASFIDEHLAKRHLRAFHACAIPAMQSDLFRYCAILTLGGIYIDADTRCIASLRSLVPPEGAGQLLHEHGGLGVINGLLAFGSPGHPFLELVLEIATANIERRISDDAYFTTGPPILTCLFWLNKLGSFDAFLEQIQQYRRLKDVASLYLDVVDDYAQVQRAFSGIKVLAAEENVWVGPPDVPLPYKGTDLHFTRAAGRIYRD